MNPQRTSLFLMANLGSEVSRMISCKEKNDVTRMDESLVRALRMIKDIQTLPDMQKRLEEISLLQQAITDIAQPKSSLDISSEQLTSYFEPFALRLLEK